jgi:hypothetical protein
LIHTGDPDFALIKTKVAEAIAKSESLDKDGSGGDGKTSNTPRSTSKPSSSSTKSSSSSSSTKKPSKKPTSSPTTPATGVDDVASICKA